MFHRYVIGRIGSLATCGAVLLYGGQALAETQSCTAAYENGKAKEDSGHLLEARGQYASCAKKACGAFLLNECMVRHARLDSDIPSVVPFATDPSGEPRSDVRVTVDGDAFVSRIDGRSVRIDPGLHEFVFHGADGVNVTQKVMVLQGDRNRRIAASLGAPHAEKPAAVAVVATPEPAVKPMAPAPEVVTKETVAPEPSPEPAAEPVQDTTTKKVPAASWVLGGLGVVGVGGFFLLSAQGRSQNDRLAQSCGQSGSCQQSSVDSVKRTYVFADISLGAGIAALGGAVLAYALSGPSNKERPAEQAYLVNVQPTKSGALASISGSF